MGKKENPYLRAAKKCGEWLISNQSTGQADANRGRFLAEIDVRTGDINEISTNWTTGMSLLSLLMLHKRTGYEKWLDAAKLAGEYLKSLQVLDSRNARNFGMIREISPQGDWCHPRDALSAAWGLLHLGQVAVDSEAAERALLFARWFKKYAMRDGYPAWTAYLDGREPYWMLGSFHGGSPLFFFDLASHTGDHRWIDEVAVPILENYLRNHLPPRGEIRVIVDPETGKSALRRKEWQNQLSWAHMHRINDDFSSMALMRSFHVTGEQSHLAAARRFLGWALKRQNSDGSFGDPPVNSGCASLMSELMDIYAIEGGAQFRAAAAKAGEHLLSLQEMETPDPRFHGGFYGMHGLNDFGTRRVLHIRTSCYAIAACLRLEGGADYPWYTA